MKININDALFVLPSNEELKEKIQANADTFRLTAKFFADDPVAMRIDIKEFISYLIESASEGTKKDSSKFEDKSVITPLINADRECVTIDSPNWFLEFCDHYKICDATIQVLGQLLISHILLERAERTLRNYFFEKHRERQEILNEYSEN